MALPARPGRLRGGQATVELALGFPLVLLGVLLVLQLALVARDRILVSHAAREAARAASVDPRPGPAADGARAASSAIDPRRLDVRTRRRGDHLTVEIRYRSPTDLPVVGALVPDPTLTATVTVRVEESHVP